MKLSDLKPYVNDPRFNSAFREYLEAKIVQAYSAMERQVEPHLFYREQGKVEVLKRLLKLRDEVNAADGQSSLSK